MTLFQDAVLTVAHCLAGIEPKRVVLVAGEHDLDFAEGTEQVLDRSSKFNLWVVKMDMLHLFEEKDQTDPEDLNIGSKV